VDSQDSRALIDVIVPVRGAGAVFARCAASLARHLDPARHRIVIVLDGPPDAGTSQAIADLTAAGQRLLVLSHERPQGFVISANRGLRASTTADAVVLNSDTQVTAGWLDRLAAAAHSDPHIATASPFSNNATICSLPVFLAENTLPSGYDVDTFAAVITRVSERAYPRLPTGAGFCLYIKRRVLDDIGLFDEVFGVGYGEEVDFCRRASRKGYHHVLDDATFVFHEGSRSFGRSRAWRVRRAHLIVRWRHPDYLPDVARFMREDPLAPVRAHVVAALRVGASAATAAPASVPAASMASAFAAGDVCPIGPFVAHRVKRILHVVHGWPPWAHGGTEQYAHGLALHQRQSRAVFVYARITDPDRAHGDAIEHWDRGMRVRLIVNNFTQRNPINRAALHSARIAADFDRFVAEVRPDVVHVHHLSGHCVSLMAVARRRGIRIVYQAQDWWPICARVNLIDSRQSFCDGPTVTKCAACLPLTRLPGAIVGNPALHLLRRSLMRSALAKADAIVMGSRFIADSYRTWRVLPESAAVHVLPYGGPDPVAFSRGERERGRGRDGEGEREAASEPSRPIRFGYIGALLPHKGVHVAIEAMTRVGSARAQLHVWGAGDDPAYRARLDAAARADARIVMHGAFPESEKSSILRSLDLLIVPSIGLESFGIVAREAMAHGVPVLASKRGALMELEGGALFEPGDAADLARWMSRAIDEPELLAQWRRGLPPIKSLAAHAEEIERVYARVMRPASR
jgi:glycosyltransferase involved in cell wall biosynthesis